MLTRLQIENFRNFGSLQTDFQSKSILITGGNGQGKTSVLEAVFYLSNLRSFRTSKLREIKKIGTASFSVEGILSNSKWNQVLSVRNGEVRQLMKDHQRVSKASDFAGEYHTVTFLPDDPEIITGEANLRRRFFDMFLSVIDKEYFSALQLYSDALKVRNHLLRNSDQFDPEILRSYHPVLASSGLTILRKRRECIENLSEKMRKILNRIRPELSNFQITMREKKREIPDESEYIFLLERNQESDRMRGFTQFGPHADDFEFNMDQKLMRCFASRGQCRILSFALKLAQFDRVRKNDLSDRKETFVLVDDAVGDLDARAKSSFFETIQAADQIFYAFAETPDDPHFQTDIQKITIRNSQIEKDLPHV